MVAAAPGHGGVAAVSRQDLGDCCGARVVDEQAAVDEDCAVRCST